jgi:CheY-like chemotaxis protein
MIIEHRLDGVLPPREGSSSRPYELHILLVEDHADTAATMAELLRQNGRDVRVAGDGAEALSQAWTSLPDVVLLDIGLPGMDGWEVARRLQQLPGSRKPFVVAITGYGQEADRDRSRQVGIHLHLVKPVDPVGLEQLLQRFQAILIG